MDAFVFLLINMFTDDVLQMNQMGGAGLMSHQHQLMSDAMDKVQKATELQARIQAKLQNVALPSLQQTVAMSGYENKWPLSSR